MTDALGLVTGFTYDTAGNVTSVTELQGTGNAVTTSYTYEPSYHLVTSVTDPLLHTTTLAYDSLGRLLTVTDPLTHETSLMWNAAGQLTSIGDPLQQTTTFTYEVGDLVAVTSPRGMTTTRFLDTLGRIVDRASALRPGLAGRLEGRRDDGTGSARADRRPRISLS